MTQVFDPDGTVHPATVIKAGPCVVVQSKTAQTDGYAAVQLAFVEETAPKANKPTIGHFKKANVPVTRVRREMKVAGGGDEAPKTGDQVLVSIFANGERVDIVGTGRGKGFQGVVRRHHFAGGAATHGSMFHRAPGSIGASSFPSRVVKGMRAAGRMGGGRVTIHNLKVLRVDLENHLLIVEGGIPGAPSSYVIVRKAVTAKKVKVAQVEKVKKGKK
jgi:large subunit ribosomal protein L3